jgi:hypothetical protein
MPSQKRQKPLYQRGDFALYPRAGRNLEIVWYDAERKRERSTSAGTSDIEEGKLALDRHYLKQTGRRMCPTCHRPWDHEGSPHAASAIADYLLLSDGKAGHEAARHRLSHVIDYLEVVGPSTACAAIDEEWIERFRIWALARPVISPKGRILRDRSLSHVEGSVMQFAAAINATPGETAKFTARQQITVTRSPTFRVDVKTLAAMFNYCIRPDEKSDKLIAIRIKDRQSLLAYLRMAVATWARPETVLAIKRDQWHPGPAVIDLNPVRRARTNKRLPMVPAAKQIIPHLDAMADNWIQAATIRSSWDKMRVALELPGDGQAGPKLIRRSMATIVRRRIGEANWRQGEIMLGHVPFAISDIYAIPDPANLGLALGATESVIDEIEALAPGAYYRNTTAIGTPFAVINGGKNG